MNDNLVGRLMAVPVYDDIKEAADLIDSQQDRIETQAAEITRLRAKLATARRDGMKDAAKWHEVRSMELSGEARVARNFRQLLHQSDFHMESAAAIRAAAGEAKL